MMLWQQVAETCYVLEPVTVPDGVGGYQTTWSKRDKLQAAVVRTDTAESSNSGKREEVAIYTITSETALAYNTFIQRENDGKVIRVTSTAQDMRTPNVASFEFYQIQGEETRLDDE